MRTFQDYAESQNNYNENWFTGIFGKRASQFQDHPEFGAAYAALLKQHGGDQAAAEAALSQMLQTPAGKHKAMSMGMGSPRQDAPGPDQTTWRATNTGGAQMFGQRPGSQRG